MTITREEVLAIYNAVDSVTDGRELTVEFVHNCISAAHSKGVELGRKLLQKSSWAEAEAMALVISHECVIEQLQQQLLATQEAYQRVVEAAAKAMEDIRYEQYNDALSTLNEALANPPSLEAVERKKLQERLQDEIAALEAAAMTCKPYDEYFRFMIVERKAKLDKMK